MGCEKTKTKMFSLGDRDSSPRLSQFLMCLGIQSSKHNSTGVFREQVSNIIPRFGLLSL